jgi:hypothetical protein
MLGLLVLCGFMLVPGIALWQAGAGVALIGLTFTLAYLLGGHNGLLTTVVNLLISLLYLADGLLIVLRWNAALLFCALLLGLSVTLLVRMCWRLLTLAMPDLRAVTGPQGRQGYGCGIAGAQ